MSLTQQPPTPSPPPVTGTSCTSRSRPGSGAWPTSSGRAIPGREARQECHGDHSLHKSPQELHREAKLLQHRSDGAPTAGTGPVVAVVLVTASWYGGYGTDKDYAAHLRGYTPDMFVFVNHPGMESTNNDTELTVRNVVLSRKAWPRAASAKCTKIFSTLMACLMVRKRRSPSIREAYLLRWSSMLLARWAAKSAVSRRWPIMDVHCYHGGIVRVALLPCGHACEQVAKPHHGVL